MTRIRFGLVAVACLGLSACLTAHYPEPAANSSTALFNFGHGDSRYDKDGVWGSPAPPQYSMIVGKDSCAKGERIAKIGYLESQRKNVRISAGAPVRLKARTLFSYVRYYRRSSAASSDPPKTHWCESVAEFTPVAGHAYRIDHSETAAGECVLEVADTADNKPPPDINIQNAIPCPPIFLSW